MQTLEINRNRQLAINISSSLVAFAVNLIINFFLSPYIVNTIGVEANGFISLANTFITYATLVTIALNSMSGRFITIAIHKNDYKLANKYYNAVFGGNLIITIVLIIPSILTIAKLDSLINIPLNLITDVKILFSILFINFFIATALPNWSTAMFATNKIHINSIRGVESNLIKVILILISFLLFKPKVYYVGLATLISSLYVTIFSKYYQVKLLPDLNIKYKYFEWKYVKKLVSSGIWNTINQAGQMLLSGLDLLIANLFIGPIEMGLLALAKTIPNVIVNLAGTLNGVFAPALTIDYANDNKNALKNSLKQGMKLTGIILTIPLTILILYGKEFYQLWVPSENASILHILSVLTCFGLIFTSGTQCLYNIFTVTNKVKTNSLLLLSSGAISTVIVFILLNTTDLGVFAIAGVSSTINLIRNMIYTIPFTAKCLGLEWNTFFPEVFSSVLSVITLTIIGSTIKGFIIVDSWKILIISCLLMSMTGLIINMIIVLSKDERKYLIDKIINKVKLF
ncbi:oligosaccharide flippase family protein [Romboutsia lituseburensis]|uniref:oligosaccharide flippase family protein n=1 Tax=Romboutsia lituseburensis TaxID=1537 RepID=UPI00215A9E7C|nr:oligosaccharide flippase family protein [Romboutsia lituseburensis]MCR8746798.1 oligosaccharide flippase family protein [Romboutsia lituseburensis]